MSGTSCFLSYMSPCGDGDSFQIPPWETLAESIIYKRNKGCQQTEVDFILFPSHFPLSNPPSAMAAFRGLIKSFGPRRLWFHSSLKSRPAFHHRAGRRMRLNIQSIADVGSADVGSPLTLSVGTHYASCGTSLLLICGMRIRTPCHLWRMLQDP